MDRRNEEQHISAERASGGKNVGVVRWVLLISLSLAIIALTAIWVTGALTHN